MINPLTSYTRWLHTRWPAGTVEKLPDVRDDGSTNVNGLYVVGDLTGIPLLKFSADSGARAVTSIVGESSFASRDTSDPSVRDLVVIGAGVSGVAAVAEARKHDLNVELIEASELFSTIANFPKGKPIYTYPTDMTPAGDLQFGGRSEVKEGLLDELHDFVREQEIDTTVARVDHVARKGRVLEVHLDGGEIVRAHRVIVGIGRSGNFRSLNVPGEDLEKVYNRLHDPQEFCGRNVLVVGGGDSAMETAIALATCGCQVTLSYRKAEFSRPKPENLEKIERLASDPGADVGVDHPSSDRVTTAAGPWMGAGHQPGRLTVEMASQVAAIREDAVDLKTASGDVRTIDNDVVFSMIGREAPLDFFRRSGVRIRGEWRPVTYVTCALFVLFCIWMYHWKTQAGLPVYAWFKSNNWFPFNLADASNPANLFGTIWTSMQQPSFYYSLAYCVCVVGFGIQRVRRRRTPYVKLQTTVLALVQCIPLFLLPYILLPWLGANGVFDSGILKSFADEFFPRGEYWRSVGFILAWPLMFWNVFTHEPMVGWLIVSFIQTFVIIPLLVWKYGKGAYCGWICSCGALAETMGDAHRHKMPHGPVWNRVNLVGQVLLWMAMGLLGLRIIAWIIPGRDWAHTVFNFLFNGSKANYEKYGGAMEYLNFVWVDDLLFAGILGVCFYFWFSGRVWCRFACPLAALMHIYARFSRFRIIADKKKCISCNVCTTVCHQGIDVMNFANKGLPMEDPECVRCSACVQSCPTGVLQFGEVNRKTGDVIRVDRLMASPVQMAELTVNGGRPR